MAVIHNYDVVNTLIKIKEAAQLVFETLGPNHSESVYQNAMYVELLAMGCEHVTLEYKKNIYYRNEIVGFHLFDLVVNKCVIVEMKVTSNPNTGKEQLKKYLKTCERNWQVTNKGTCLKHGVLINMESDLFIWDIFNDFNDLKPVTSLKPLPQLSLKPSSLMNKKKDEYCEDDDYLIVV